MQANITLTNDDDFIFIAHFITYTLNVLNTENGDVKTCAGLQCGENTEQDKSTPTEFSLCE